MRDEESGEEIRCGYCRSVGDCPHLLAVIDRSFVECSGGYAFDRYAEFGEAIEKAFLALLSMDQRGRPNWQDSDLAELWTGAAEDYSPGDEDVPLDGDCLNRLIIDLFCEAGGEEYPGSIDDGGGPGFSSAISLFYAERPREVFESALSRLRNRIGS